MENVNILRASINNKYLLLMLFILFLFSVPLKGQKTTFSEILGNAEKVDDVGKLYAIFNLDVIKYFELEDTFDTDLKQKTFKKTEDYGQYLNTLKELKARMNDKSYYFEYRQGFRDNHYDLKRGGFLFTISTNDVSDWMTTGTQKTINGIYFSSIYSIKYKPYPRQPNIYYEKIVIPVNEDNALKIENNYKDIEDYNEDIKTHFVFKLSGITFVENMKYHKKEKLFKAMYTRIIIANVKTEEIYFDKTYNGNAPKHENN